MKRVWGVIALATGCVVTVVSIFSVYVIFRKPSQVDCTAQNLNIAIDQRYSPQFRTEIENYIKTISHQNISTIAQTLQKKYPAILAVTIEQSAQATNISIDSVIPWSTINKQYVVDSLGNQLSSACFDPAIIEQLPNFSIDPKELTNRTHQRRAHHFATQLPRAFFDTFDVFWKDQTHIYLTTKTKPSWCILTYDSQSFNEKIISQCCDCVQSTQSNVKQQKNSTLVADIRFEKQIVLYHKNMNLFDEA
jgi:hypothetical protein